MRHIFPIAKRRRPSWSLLAKRLANTSYSKQVPKVGLDPYQVSNCSLFNTPSYMGLCDSDFSEVPLETVSLSWSSCLLNEKRKTEAVNTFTEHECNFRCSGYHLKFDSRWKHHFYWSDVIFNSSFCYTAQRLNCMQCKTFDYRKCKCYQALNRRNTVIADVEDLQLGEWFSDVPHISKLARWCIQLFQVSSKKNTFSIILLAAEDNTEIKHENQNGKRLDMILRRCCSQI